MAKVLTTGSEWLWLDTADPGVSETDISIGNLWLNTTSDDLFVCKDNTIGAQIWDKYPNTTVSVAEGGTGAVTLTGVLTGNGTGAFTAAAVTENGVLYGGASNAVTSLAVAATGTVLIGNTAAAPSFSATPAVTSVAIGSGALTITSGTGAPGSTQPKGSLYLRTDGGGINDRLYVATDGAGSWTAIVTAT